MKVEIRKEEFKVVDRRLKYDKSNKTLTLVIQKEVNRNTLFVR